jgi:hypothetical protein
MYFSKTYTSREKMNSNGDKFKEVVKNIGPVDGLSTKKLIEVSRNLFRLVPAEEQGSACNKFYHHDYEHSSTCKSCQRMMLLYYLGRCMEKLADEDKLPQFKEAGLSHTRIRDRTYGYIKIGSQLIFSIDRHLNAWKNEARMQIIIQTWVFDLQI